MYNHSALVDEPIFVEYLDLSGGLNTKKDAHALSRNQLAQSINGWYSSGNSLSKRPGNVAAITASGATGSGLSGQAATSARFLNKTVGIFQSANTLYAAAADALAFTNIGTVTAGGIVNSTQLQDPLSNTARLFVVTGKDAPRGWDGSGALVALTGLPSKLTGANVPITPKYAANLFSTLFYAGDDSDPSAVWISDPFQPESFTYSATLSPPSAYGITNGSYIPYFIGRNNGVSGGDITGLAAMRGSMIVYKQSAIYKLSLMGLYGDSVWRTDLISSSIGCLSPRSIVAFDDFHLILAIDGIYLVTIDGTKRISDNVPTFFDSTSGTPASILDRTTAVGVRCGQRYLVFFDDGAGSGTATGRPTTGLWFDFAKLDEDGLPTVGQLAGMQVSGVVALRGPFDDGLFLWTDGSTDRVGKFGVGTADFAGAITTSLVGKADLLTEVIGEGGMARARKKTINDVRLFLSLPQISTDEELTFTTMVTYDQLSSLPTIINTLPVAVGGGGAIVGVAQVGNMANATLGVAGATAQYQVVRANLQNPATGKVLQIGFSESSIYPWTTLGYAAEVAVDRLGGLDA